MELYDFPHIFVLGIFFPKYFCRGVQTINQINIDLENHQFLMETNLPTSARVEVLIYQSLSNFERNEKWGWKTSETIKNWLFSGSTSLFTRVE